MSISELQAITGRSVLMYPLRAASARLGLPTFAAGSDGIRGLMNLLFVPGHIVLTEHKV